MYAHCQEAGRNEGQDWPVCGPACDSCLVWGCLGMKYRAASSTEIYCGWGGGNEIAHIAFPLFIFRFSHLGSSHGPACLDISLGQMPCASVPYFVLQDSSGLAYRDSLCSANSPAGFPSSRLSFFTCKMKQDSPSMHHAIELTVETAMTGFQRLSMMKNVKYLPSESNTLPSQYVINEK